MKSYLSGNPDLKLALNEDLVIGRENAVSGAGIQKYLCMIFNTNFFDFFALTRACVVANYGAVVLDDCNFHECVRLDDFEHARTLSFRPPDGEFAVLNYRITEDFRAPFRIFPFFELVTPYKIELVVKVRIAYFFHYFLCIFFADSG